MHGYTVIFATLFIHHYYCLPKMATVSSTVMPFLEKSLRVASSSISLGGNEESTNLTFGGPRESLRPRGTSILGPPDSETASLAAKTRTSAHETCPGHTCSNDAFIRSIMILFLIPKLFDEATSEGSVCASRRIEASQPYHIM